jgi:hypothetical protein
MAQGQSVALYGLARPAVGARTEEYARKDYRPKVFHIAFANHFWPVVSVHKGTILM